jgi:cyanophycinase
VSRAFAFLGAGEFQAWHADVDRWLLDRSSGDGSVLVIPTASAPEGTEVFDSWAEQGLLHYTGLGVPVEVLDVRVRDDAMTEAAADRVGAASMVFLSGGNPAYLATALAGTPLWQRLCDRLDDGLAYAGCSAGVACLSDPTFDSAQEDVERIWAPGLRFFPGTLFAPHWDIVDMWIPGARAFITEAAGERFLIGIDEQTAMVGDGTSWTVRGSAGVHVHEDGTWKNHGPGSTFELRLT